MKQKLSILAVAAALICSILGSPQTSHAQPFAGFAIPKDSTAAHRATAERTAKYFGMTSSQLDRNPVCCVWMEIRPWRPAPGEDGYIIIHQGGGTLIMATNQEQLDAAADRLTAASRNVAGKREVPVGLMTNFKVLENANATQASSDQAAASPDSKSSGSDKSQPESVTPIR